MKSIAPDFFIFNGDQIYVDGTCNDLTNLVKNNYRYWQNKECNFKRVNDIDWNDKDKLNKTFLQHWEYNREDPHLQNFLNDTSMYSQSDDHEVIDNYGNWSFYEVSKYPIERNKTGYPNLVKTGINYFFEFSPIKKNKENPVIFITTDVHYATTVKVSQDFDRDGDLFTFYEMTNGPLSVYTTDKPYPLDPTINATYLYSESAIFNFGHIKIV